MNKTASLILPIIGNIIRPQARPYFCTYITTWRCNARCQMCDIWEKKNTEEISPEEVSRIFKQIPSLKIVRLSGGEPFLRKDFPDIIQAIDGNRNISVIHITTNGILTVDVVKALDKAYRANIHLKISLNAYGKRHDEAMGVDGAYEKAMATIEAIVNLRHRRNIFVGINQTITNMESYCDSHNIRKLCRKYEMAYLPVLAYRGASLYGSESSSTEFELYGDFTHAQIKEMLEDFIQEAGRVRDIRERCMKRYYLKGLYQRLVKGTCKPSPKCVALRKHIRISPDGSVPVCLYNDATVGNVVRDSFKAVWEGEKAYSLRQWVDACKGCWVQCETIPSAIFSRSMIFNLIS